MGNNYRGGRGGGRPSDRGGFGRRSFDRGNDRGGGRDRQMFKAVCANCGKDCEVPFRPTNNKPVYCSDCFEKMGGGGRSERPNDRPRFDDRRPQGGGNPDQNKGQFDNLNIKLDKILRLLDTKAQPKEPVKSQKPVMETDKKSGVIMEAGKDADKPDVKVLSQEKKESKVKKVTKAAKKKTSKAKK